MRTGYVSAASRIAALVGLAIAGTGCVVNIDAAAVTVRDEKRFTVKGTPEVTLATFDGSIEVRAWDRAEVFVEIEKRGADKTAAESIEVKAEQSGDRISVEARRPPGVHSFFGFGISPSAKIIASVPRQANLAAHSGDGSIAIERIAGRIELQTDDGSIRGTDLSGELRVHTGDGSMRLDGIEGRVDLESGDGGIVIGGKLAGVRVQTSDGAVSIRAREGSTITEAWDVRTGDGSVSIELPTMFNAELDATAGDGSVRVERLNLTMSGEMSRRAVKGRIGSGGPTLKVRTGDGSIEISKS